MNLGTKIFLVFSTSVLILLGSILYLIGDQTKKREVVRISSDLESTHRRFQVQLEAQQANTLKLVETITLDQKFRSFLSQIKDNFYSFTEEIAVDAEADIVFMVDDELTMHGIYPSDEKSQSWFNDHSKSFKVMDVIDNGKALSQVISVGGELFVTVYVPLKELLSDDYAIGVIAVFKKMDDEWLKWLLDKKVIGPDTQVLFFADQAAVASNMAPEATAAVLSAQDGKAGEVESLVIEGERFITMRHFFETADGKAGYAVSSSLDRALEPFKALQKKIMFIGMGIIFLGMCVFYLFSRRLVQPLKLLVDGTWAVTNEDYTHRIQYNSKDEVGTLARAFNHMMEGLEEKERTRKTLDTYVNPAVVAEIMANPEKFKLGGERQVQSILFSDVVGFTTFSEKMDPGELILLLNEYLGAMTHELSQVEGILDKYIGDAIMAFWGPPFCKGNHAFLACRAAINMQNKLAGLREKWSREGKPELQARIGIATGEMIVGNIGSEQSKDYTCIGDTVNLGARLEGLNKYYGTSIMIDETTYKRTYGLFARELDTVQVKGRQRGSPVYELIGFEEDETPETLQKLVQYASALAIYREGDFILAAKKFDQVVKNFPGDGPGQMMLERCKNYAKNPPREWLGVHMMEEK